MKTKLSIFYAVLTSLLLGQSLAYAQLVIDKGKVNLVVKPGEKLVETLHLKNGGESDLTAKIYMEDFIYSPPYEGTKEFFTAGTRPDSNSNWITIAPREVTLAPGAEKDVSYVVNVPPDIKSGSYQGVMIFENLPAKISSNPLVKTETKTAQAGMSFILRIGTLIFIQTEDAVVKAGLEDFVFDGSKLNFHYKNEGQSLLVTEMKYYVMDEEGNVHDRGDGEKKYLPSGEATDLSIELSGDLPAGAFTLVLSLNADGYDVLVKEVDFTKSQNGVMSVGEIRE